MNLGTADYDGLQTQISYRGSSEAPGGAQLHALESDQHDRARRQRHRIERRQHRAPGRRGARAERRRSAASRGHHGQLRAAAQHHRRHADAIRVGAAVQRRRPASTTTATAPTTIGRSSTARCIAKSAFRGTAHPGRRRCSSRAGSRLADAHSICCGMEGFNLLNHANILARAQTTYGDTDYGESNVRPGRRGGDGDQRASGAREHRSAADVPVPGAASCSDRESPQRTSSCGHKMHHVESAAVVR